MPTDATVETQTSIGWRGAYVPGAELRAPASVPLDGLKLYAYASIKDLPNTTSATGVGELAPAVAGEIVSLPAEVSLKTTPKSAGTGTVRPGDVNFGPSPNAPLIKCEAKNADELTAYSLTVTAAGQQPGTNPSPSAGAPAGSSPSPSPVATRSPSPTPTPTPTPSRRVPSEAVDEFSPRPKKEIERTPIGGAATGGGGMAGPDGRLLVLTGSLLALTALTGLFLRRRAASRG